MEVVLGDLPFSQTMFILPGNPPLLILGRTTRFMEPADRYDSQLRRWAGRHPVVLRLWRFTSSERPADWPQGRIELAVEIDRTKQRDGSPYVSWFFDQQEVARSIFNETSCDFRLAGYFPEHDKIIRDVGLTGVLLHPQEPYASSGAA